MRRRSPIRLRFSAHSSDSPTIFTSRIYSSPSPFSLVTDTLAVVNRYHYTRPQVSVRSCAIPFAINRNHICACPHCSALLATDVLAVVRGSIGGCPAMFWRPASSMVEVIRKTFEAFSGTSSPGADTFAGASNHLWGCQQIHARWSSDICADINKYMCGCSQIHIEFFRRRRTNPKLETRNSVLLQLSGAALFSRMKRCCNYIYLADGISVEPLKEGVKNEIQRVSAAQ